MQQSTRNRIAGTVQRIVSDKVVSEIIIATPLGEIAAVITTASVRELGLAPGEEVFALIKATNVSVARQVTEAPAPSKAKTKKKKKKTK